MLRRLIGNTHLFPKQIQPMKFGDMIITSSPFLAIVVTGQDNSTDIRKECLEKFSKLAYQCRLSRVKKYSHVNYWYDGPIGNQGVNLWEEGAFHRARYGVIGISRLFITDSEETLIIAKKAVDLLLENNNMVLFFPEHKEEISFYETLFPTAMQLLWNNKPVV